MSYMARLETTPQNLSLGVLERLAKTLAVYPHLFLTDPKQTQESATDAPILKEFSRLLKKTPSTRYLIWPAK